LTIKMTSASTRKTGDKRATREKRVTGTF
jgi:hypothetical protein